MLLISVETLIRKEFIFNSIIMLAKQRASFAGDTAATATFYRTNFEALRIHLRSKSVERKNWLQSATSAERNQVREFR